MGETNLVKMTRNRLRNSYILKNPIENDGISF